MSDTEKMSETEAITAVLSDHIQSARNQRCTCGWRPDASKSLADPNNVHQQHRRHVAEMLHAAGFRRVQK